MTGPAMPLNGRLARQRRLTLGDLVFLVALAALPLTALASVARSLPPRDVLLFAGMALGAHAAALALLDVALGGQTLLARVVRSLVYGLVGCVFIVLVVTLVLMEPWNGALVGLSVLITLFYAVSWC